MMIFEPSPEKIMDQLIAKHFIVQIYRCLSESVAAEHGARMTAMEKRDEKRGRDDQSPDVELQQTPSGCDHDGIDRDHERRRGFESLGLVREKFLKFI